MSDVKLQDKYQLFIGGEWKDASDGAVFTTTCPADGRVLAQCAEATRDDVDAAVEAAWKAFPAWKKSSVSLSVNGRQFSTRSLIVLMPTQSILPW